MNNLSDVLILGAIIAGAIAFTLYMSGTSRAEWRRAAFYAVVITTVVSVVTFSMKWYDLQWKDVPWWNSMNEDEARAHCQWRGPA